MPRMKKVSSHLFRQCGFLVMILAWNLAQINVFKRGKITKFDGTSLSDGSIMKGLIEGSGYKYLGILQSDQIQTQK